MCLTMLCRKTKTIPFCDSTYIIVMNKFHRKIEIHQVHFRLFNVKYSSPCYLTISWTFPFTLTMFLGNVAVPFSTKLLETMLLRFAKLNYWASNIVLSVCRQACSNFRHQESRNHRHCWHLVLCQVLQINEVMFETHVQYFSSMNLYNVSS